MTALTITELVKMAGENSRDHGFHEDWPSTPADGYISSSYDRDISLAVTEKLALIHEEVSEALGEIRSGHTPEHVYYPGGHAYVGSGSGFCARCDAFPNGPSKPVLKPEGFGVELADAVIRIADLAYLTGIDLEALIREKHAYNATRPRKHGRKF